VLQHPPQLLQPASAQIRDHGMFVVYWITLGVLSSVGLGMTLPWVLSAPRASLSPCSALVSVVSVCVSLSLTHTLTLSLLPSLSLAPACSVALRYSHPRCPRSIHYQRPQCCAFPSLCVFGNLSHVRDGGCVCFRLGAAHFPPVSRAAHHPHRHSGVRVQVHRVHGGDEQVPDVDGGVHR
jgi:hypothetical protein